MTTTHTHNQNNRIGSQVIERALLKGQTVNMGLGLLMMLLLSGLLWGSSGEKKLDLQGYQSRLLQAQPSDVPLRSVSAFESSISNCTGAINIEVFHELHKSMVEAGVRGQRRHTGLIFRNTTRPVIAKSLKLLNAGSGTTGTGGLKKVLCNDLNLRAINHMDRCETGQRLAGHINRLVAWKSELLCCLGYADANYQNHEKHQRRCLRIREKRGVDCSAGRFLEKLEVAIHASIVDRPLEAISDSPVDFLFPELFSLSTEALVIMSIRGWTSSYLHTHALSVCFSNSDSPPPPPPPPSQAHTHTHTHTHTTFLSPFLVPSPTFLHLLSHSPSRPSTQSPIFGHARGYTFTSAQKSSVRRICGTLRV